tara:strand:- start:2913 stop:3467 length:555 start_codon:yes stop_codon:yes gene_type:complete
MPKLRKMKYKEHREKWNKCQACELSCRRKKVVLARGTLPCEVLFIGEAPGDAEDVLGTPFAGPAGYLLKEMVDASVPGNVKKAYTNLIACIPKDESGMKQLDVPEEYIKACLPRLEEMVKMSKPRLIVCVGKLSAKWMTLNFPETIADWVEIYHPAYILRLDISQKGLAIQRTIVALRDATEEL